MTMLETSIVHKFEKNGEIFFWVRYADDVFCIIEKGKSNIILTEINNFDSFLTDTIKKNARNCYSIVRYDSIFRHK